MPKHIKPSDLPNPETGKVVRHVVTLEKGDTAWMPGTTKHVIKGPKKVIYKIFSFDRVDYEVLPLDDAGTVMDTVLILLDAKNFPIRIYAYPDGMDGTDGRMRAAGIIRKLQREVSRFGPETWNQVHSELVAIGFKPLATHTVSE